MTDESWAIRARKGDYRAIDAASHDRSMEYAVQGLMPATGATIWFGAGSTGKTQLLLWLAAHIAASGDAAPSQWLGADLHARGNILVLTAEDLREHVLQRIGMIARRMMDETGGTNEDAVALCSRIHVMAFLSMTDKEFAEPNACLFERGSAGRWQPSAVLKGVEAFLDDWNRQVVEDGHPEDKIVGVILDSAVSMAGFELANSEATTNFLFYLNRLSRRQKMFWAVIGHTPKDAAKKTEDAAIERLRGSAMWSTTPRTVVEVRLAGDSENLETVRAALPTLSERDIVIVQVAKANSLGADLEPRALLRRKDGAYDHVTPDFPDMFGKMPTFRRRGVKAHTPELREALVSLLESLAAEAPGKTLSREDIRVAFGQARSDISILATIDDAVDSTSAKSAGTLAFELSAMKKSGMIDIRDGKIKIINLRTEDATPLAEAAD
jgi:hypothetical protein